MRYSRLETFIYWHFKLHVIESLNWMHLFSCFFLYFSSSICDAFIWFQLLCICFGIYLQCFIVLCYAFVFRPIKHLFACMRKCFASFKKLKPGEHRWVLGYTSMIFVFWQTSITFRNLYECYTWFVFAKHLLVSLFHEMSVLKTHWALLCTVHATE